MTDRAWLDSVVKVTSHHRAYDHDNPWKWSMENKSSAAVVIAPGRLLCSADLVANATELEVRTRERSSPVTARVHAVNHDCDLALLEAPDLLGLAPVPLGELPAYWDEIAITSFSESFSVVRGVVSKVLVARYAHSQRHALVVACDASSEEGAGPAFLDGKLVGIAIQKAVGERVVELVPAPIIANFLVRATTGGRFHMPALGVTTQNLTNPTLREHYQLTADTRGMLVIDVAYGESADGILERGDVITAVDGMPVDDSGLVSYGVEHEVRYDVVAGLHQVGDRLRVDIVRGGRAMTVILVLTRWMPLVPRAGHDTIPPYVIFGGLVFQPLTRDYLTTWDEWWNNGPKEFLDAYYRGARTVEQLEVVVLTQILANDLNAGYEHLYNEAIAKLNGRLPRDFAELRDTLARATGKVVIETTSGGIIVLDAEAARACGAPPE